MNAKLVVAAFLAPPSPEARSMRPRVIRARPEKNTRSHEEIIADAKKRFKATLAYLADR